MLDVLYLVFNEGHTAATGDRLTRPDLSSEAIRLARQLARLMPDEPEVVGLLAMMLYHATRGELLRRLGQQDAAADAYRCALDLAANAIERRFLDTRLAALRS